MQKHNISSAYIQSLIGKSGHQCRIVAEQFAISIRDCDDTDWVRGVLDANDVLYDGDDKVIYCYGWKEYLSISFIKRCLQEHFADALHNPPGKIWIEKEQEYSGIWKFSGPPRRDLDFLKSVIQAGFPADCHLSNGSDGRSLTIILVMEEARKAGRV